MELVPRRPSGAGTWGPHPNLPPPPVTSACPQALGTIQNPQVPPASSHWQGDVSHKRGRKTWKLPRRSKAGKEGSWLPTGLSQLRVLSLLFIKGWRHDPNHRRDGTAASQVRKAFISSSSRQPPSSVPTGARSIPAPVRAEAGKRGEAVCVDFGRAFVYTVLAISCPQIK